VRLTALRDSPDMPIVEKLAELGVVLLKYCDACRRLLITTDPEQKVHRGSDVSASFCDDGRNGELHRHRWAEFRSIAGRLMGRELEEEEVNYSVDFFFGQVSDLVLRVPAEDKGFGWKKLHLCRCYRCGTVLVRFKPEQAPEVWKGRPVSNRCPECRLTDSRWVRYVGADGKDPFAAPGGDPYYTSLSYCPWEGEEVFDPVVKFNKYSSQGDEMNDALWKAYIRKHMDAQGLPNGVLEKLGLSKEKIGEAITNLDMEALARFDVVLDDHARVQKDFQAWCAEMGQPVDWDFIPYRWRP